MSWIFGNAKRGAPNAEIDGRAAAREQQIRNLHERIPHLQQKSSDNCLYEVEIRAPPDRRKVTLRVFLPTKFPDERPGRCLVLFFSIVLNMIGFFIGVLRSNSSRCREVEIEGSFLIWCSALPVQLRIPS